MEIVILKNRNIMSIPESLVREIGCFVRVSTVFYTYIYYIICHVLTDFYNKYFT